jgi:hypothetical protein
MGGSGGCCIMPLSQLLPLLLPVLLLLALPAAALGEVDSFAGQGRLLLLLLPPPLSLFSSAAAEPSSCVLDACRTQLGGRKTPAQLQVSRHHPVVGRTPQGCHVLALRHVV